MVLSIDMYQEQFNWTSDIGLGTVKYKNSYISNNSI